MTIFSGDTFTDQIRVFFNPIRSDSGFVSPIRSGPVRSGPVRSGPVRSWFCQSDPM